MGGSRVDVGLLPNLPPHGRISHSLSCASSSSRPCSAFIRRRESGEQRGPCLSYAAAAAPTDGAIAAGAIAAGVLAQAPAAVFFRSDFATWSKTPVRAEPDGVRIVELLNVDALVLQAKVEPLKGRETDTDSVYRVVAAIVYEPAGVVVDLDVVEHPSGLRIQLHWA